jgi:hypothetical protein
MWGKDRPLETNNVKIINTLVDVQTGGKQGQSVTMWHMTVCVLASNSSATCSIS